MSDDFRIREAVAADAAGLAAVWVHTSQAAYREQLPDDYLDSMSIDDRTERWREGIASPDGPIRVAEHDGNVVGWACWGLTRDDDTGGIGELYGMYVLPDFWGAGIGPSLMREAKEWLTERYRSASLWTLKSNVRAQRFYEREGWTRDGTERDDDSNGFVFTEVRYRISF